MFSRRKTPAGALRRKPAVDLSLGGLLYVGMMLFMVMAAMNTKHNLLYAMVGLMGGVLVVSLFVSRLVLRKIEVHRELPDHAIVGQPATVEYQFRNRKGYWPSLSVSITELDSPKAFTRPPQAYVLHAAAGMTATVPARLVPTRRGVQSLERYEMATSFPFGFIKRAIERQRKDSLLVYPAMAQVEPRLLERCISEEFTSSRMRPRPGGADEFYGVKEFREGDNPRLINWRRTARTGTVVANEMTRVSPPRLVVLVDTHLRDRGSAEHALVERAIATAASVVDHALSRGMAVGLHAWAGHVLGISPSRGKRHRRELLTALARLPINTDCPPEKLLGSAHDSLRGGATAVIVTPHELELGLASLGRGRCIVLSLSSPLVRDAVRFDPSIDFAACMPLDQQPPGH
jgi:uncharacterized protein (DUF58 family)